MLLESVLKLIAVPFATSNCGDGRPTSQKNTPMITLPTATTALIPEDAATTFSAEMHAFAFEHIFPHLGRVAKADEIEL